MQQIEIDFDVFKALTARRSAEGETYNDVLRSVLKLPAHVNSAKATAHSPQPWIVDETSFPEGSEFRKVYKGKLYIGTVKDGELCLSDGFSFISPSTAAKHITGWNVNGWRFWKCRLPGASAFVPIERLRGKKY